MTFAETGKKCYSLLVGRHLAKYVFIIERLSQQAGLLKPRIDDWRAMADCVMIDSAYDGKVFNVALSDVPEKKTDLVRGSYELPAPSGETTLAVKIIDMPGEEARVTKSMKE